MNSNIKLLHDTAMDFHDMGKKAKIMGNGEQYRYYLQIAFLLEKEAALKYYALEENTLWRYTLLRSAGWLALENNALEEAEQLANLGLNGGASGLLKLELEEILENIGDKYSNTIKNSGYIHLFGILSFADADQKIIKIRENGDKDYQSIQVGEKILQDIIRFYFGEVVKVTAKLNKTGFPTLENIQKAA